MRRTSKRLLSILLGLLVAFAIGETVCRIAGLDGLPDVDPEVLAQRERALTASMYRRSRDPLLIYEMRPDYSERGRRLTEAGGILRETNVPLEKPPGVYRIVVLGDSISATIGARLHRGTRPFPDLLEGLLNGSTRAGGTRFEVLNFGTDGYGTLQEARQLETRGERYDPDLVLIQYCYNDPGVNVTPGIWFLDVMKPVSYLYSFVASIFRGERALEPDPRYSRLVPDLGPATPEARRHWEALYEPDSASWRRVVTGFERIAAVASRRRIPVVLVLFPLLVPRAAEDPGLSETRRRVLGEARRNGFLVVDLEDDYSSFPIADLQEFPGIDIYHPSPLGHEIAAEAIAGYLRKAGLIP